MTLRARAESSQSGSHVTTTIQTLPWSVWPPPQRLTQSGSHLEPRFHLILCTQPPTHSITYALDSSLPMQSKGVSGCGSYLCFAHLSRNWGYHFSSVTRWRGVWAVGWTQPSLLLPCADVSLVWWRGLTFSLVPVVAG